MTMIAYAFLQHRRPLASARREKNNEHHHSQACQRYVMPSSSQHALAASAMSALSEMAQLSAVMHSAKVVLSRVAQIKAELTPEAKTSIMVVRFVPKRCGSAVYDASGILR